MLCYFDARLLEVAGPNDKGYVDVTVLPDKSNGYPERLWCKASEEVGQLALGLKSRGEEAVKVRIRADVRPAVTKNADKRGYLNMRLDGLDAAAGAASGPRSVKSA